MDWQGQPALIDSQAYRLMELKVYNWGPFGGFHRAEFDLRGAALVGPTGSGKTSLVDALMTLLDATPRYNLASTGGHESDRDLMSYLRGVAGAGNETGGNEHVARVGKTVTGLCATMSNGVAQVQLASLMWLDSGSTAMADRKDIWLFYRDAEQVHDSLERWLTLREDEGIKGFRQLDEETPSLQHFRTKKAYFAELRRFFEVGDNAFALLNRAAGLKQLNSIDQIFRELVLDDQAKFNDAEKVANEFDGLTEIHAELELARAQQASLQPIAKESERYAKLQEDRATVNRLRELLPRSFAGQAARLWRIRQSEGHKALAEVQRVIEARKLKIEDMELRERNAHQRFMAVGGADLENLEQRITLQETLLRRCQTAANDYQQAANVLELSEELNEFSLASNLARLTELFPQLEKEVQAADDEAFDAGARVNQFESRKSELLQELEETRKRHQSNIPTPYHQFRCALAEQLGVDNSLLVFVAELVAVKPEEQRWRGAIERAIGAHRLRLLVPSEQSEAALRWVNGRDNRLHVRLYEARPVASAPRFLDDGFTRKLSYKPHPLRDAAKQFLADIDLHCVDSTEHLRSLPYSLTREGLISGKAGRFDKQDHRSLIDDWMTGFDNKDRLAALNNELTHTEHALDAAKKEKHKQRGVAASLTAKLSQARHLAETQFETIDVPGAEIALQRLVDQRAALQQPGSDVDRARKSMDDLLDLLVIERKEQSKDESNRGGIAKNLETVNERLQDAENRMGEPLTEADTALLAHREFDSQAFNLGNIEATEREQIGNLNAEFERIADQINNKSKDLVRLMGKALELDRGALAEAGSELEDVPAYIKRLAVLTTEALPEKQQRFREYLNQSSDQGVTQLLTAIDNEVSLIEERIADLNETLRRVEFEQGRYLQLEPRKVVHDDLRTLLRAQQHHRAAALKDDDGQAQYRALQHLVGLLRDAAERRRTKGAQALLDPRYRLRFFVSVIDRATDVVIEQREGSQSGSGGEKEIFASYILTASLSYALCPPGASRPLFGTIVLDEAFSKSSRTVAGRIIAALKEFGLHPLFVTPNKEMRLLRDHTRSAILVNRKDGESSLLSMSWEAFAEQAEKRRVESS